MRFRSGLVTLALVSLFLFSLDRAGALSVPRTLLGNAVNPLQVGWTRITQAALDRLGSIEQIGSLAEDNLSLRRENDQLKADNAELELLKNENVTLRQQLGVAADRGLRLAAAQVLGQPPSTTSRELILDQGSANGIKVGQIVIVGSVALGKVISVEPEKSTLQLLTDPAAQVLAKTSHGAKGLLIGQFQSSAKLTKILQEEVVNVGDQVMTAGGDGWPKDLIIGQVVRLARQEGELFQEAEVKPALRSADLEIVFIILGSQ